MPVAASFLSSRLKRGVILRGTRKLLRGTTYKTMDEAREACLRPGMGSSCRGLWAGKPCHTCGFATSMATADLRPTCSNPVVVRNEQPEGGIGREGGEEEGGDGEGEGEGEGSRRSFDDDEDDADDTDTDSGGYHSDHGDPDCG